jgi:hypothetical protein
LIFGFGLLKLRTLPNQRLEKAAAAAKDQLSSTVAITRKSRGEQENAGWHLAVVVSENQPSPPKQDKPNGFKI